MYKPWLVDFRVGVWRRASRVAGRYRGGIGDKFEVLRIVRVVQHGVDTGREEQESRSLREGVAETDRQREIRNRENRLLIRLICGKSERKS
jgi:hypothetical protein